MTEDGANIYPSRYNNFVSLGGLAILTGLAIHIIANIVLKEFPPANPSSAELQSYLSNEADTWAIVHGIRYIAIVCIVIFSCGLFIKTRYLSSTPATGWALVGIFGAILMMANLLITNGIEVMAFYDFRQLSEKDELFRLIFNLTRVLFTGEIITWALFIFGFSMAGYQSATMPRWLIILGIVEASACFLSAIFIVSVLREGWATMLIEIASFAGLIWFVCTGVYMLPKKSLNFLKKRT